MFSGCRLTLIDEGGEATLRDARTKSGQQAFEELERELRSIGEGLSSPAVGKRRVREIVVTPAKFRLLVDCTRLVDSRPDLPPLFHWAGGYHVEPKDQGRLFIAEIDKKRQRYRKPVPGKFWLLMYSSDMLPQESDPMVVAAKQHVRTVAHPFDAVWFLYPYSNQDLGHLLNLFQG